MKCRILIYLKKWPMRVNMFMAMYMPAFAYMIDYLTASIYSLTAPLIFDSADLHGGSSWIQL